MTQTTISYLNQLLSDYTPASTYFDAARGHRWSIEARLDLKLGVAEMFETGSLKHGTGVSGFSDADYIVSLKGARPTSDTSLLKVKTELQDRFQQTVVKIRKPAVVCDFASATETVEVVPAFATNPGYWIPDPTGGWMLTHPKNHNSYVDDANKSFSGGAKKLARLAKVWKYKRNVPVSSCYLEMRAAKYANDQTWWDMPEDIYWYLKRLLDNDLAAMNDPTGLGSRFTAYSSESNKADALSKLSTAVSRANKARDHAKNGYHASAIEQYKLLFNQ